MYYHLTICPLYQKKLNEKKLNKKNQIRSVWNIYNDIRGKRDGDNEIKRERWEIRKIQ